MAEEQPARQIAIGSHIAQALGQGAKATINIFRGGTEEQHAMRNRQAMLQRVRNFWVKGVLEQSLHGAAMIELGLEERADAVERPWDMVLQMPDQPKRPLPSGTKIVDVFDQMNRALLILGEPGSGKTTTLLELARDTIACAEEDPMQPIPVVFNLSSWAENRPTLTGWLMDELNTKYHIPKKVARSWVENDALSLLLDGLDEVELEHREACVRAINDFRRGHGLMPLVVCSRVADYEALTTRLELQGAVFLQPLTLQQVDHYLEGVGVELMAVRKTLQHDTTLQELAQSPLMLSIMTLAYQGMSAIDLGSLDSIEARRGHVLEAYVQQMFRRRGDDHPYSPERTVHWLAWLAQRMSQYAQTVFAIGRMQLYWLRARARPWVRVIARFLVGLLCGVLFGLFFGLYFVPLLGLIFGLPIGLFGGLYVAEMETSAISNLGIRQSAKNALVKGLIGGGIGGLIGMLFFRLNGFGLLLGLIGGLYCGLWFGGLTCIRHLALRFILYLNGHIPWNYARFLDYATDRIFLRKVGGGYMFIHRLLMEYFASLEDDPSPEDNHGSRKSRGSGDRLNALLLEHRARWESDLHRYQGIQLMAAWIQAAKNESTSGS